MSTLHVAFKVGSAEYVISTADVLHLETFSDATRIPGAPAFVAGLVQVRGKLVPVIDLRTRFGLEAAERSTDSRIIVCRVGPRVAALLVDSARDVLRLDETTFEPPPEIVADQSGGFVKSVATVANRLFLVVDLPRIIGEDHARVQG